MTGAITDNSERKRAEQTLRESEERYRHLFDANPHPMWVYDTETLRFLAVNDAAVDHYGYTREEFARMTLADIRPADDMGRFLRKAESVRVAELSKSGSWKHRKKDGTVIDVEITSHALDFLGRPARLVLVQDVTARMRAEEALAESEARFRAIVEQAAAGIVLADLAGRIIQVNRRFCTLIGYSEDQLLGRHFRDITHPADVPRNVELFERLLSTGETIATEKRYLRPDGSPIWVNSSVALVRDAAGRPTHALVVVQDISEHKRAEAALAEADRRKDAFIATLAHELRNPLAPIRTGVHIMRRLAGNDEQHGSQLLSMIERQVKHMSHLLDDLLDVSRITRNRIELRRERIELAQVIQAAVEANRPLIEEMGHVLAVRLPPEPIVLDADPVRLAQVFSNLLNNAAKYMDAGGHIEVSGQRQGEHVLVSVRDHGIGIPAANLSSIFEMFSQVGGSLSKSQGGLGIGLSLVKGLVALHGGSVEARSGGPGQGSEFLVRLPVLPEQNADRSDPAPAATPTQLKILVVDDNIDAASSLALWLKLTGNEVRTARDGSEATRVATDFLPQVVLLDLGMPTMNGYEVLRQLRLLSGGSAMTVIALTGWGQDEDRRKTRAAGFDEHLVKPVHPDALLKVLGEVQSARG